MLLGLERLVQAFRIAPALHHAAGELVDDDDLVVADDVVLVALEQRVGAQRLVDVVDQRDVVRRRRGSPSAAGRARAAAPRSCSVPLFGQVDRALLLVELVIALVAGSGISRVDGVVEIASGRRAGRR